MDNLIKMTELEFENKYTPQINHIERAMADVSVADEDICAFNGCMYETFGKELEYVMEMAKQNRVVTIIDGDTEINEFGEDYNPVYYVSGFHHVNRFGFLVVDKPLEEEFEIKLDY
jgi:hypothetical protein